MKVSYFCEFCGGQYGLEKDAINCELQHVKEKENSEKIKKEQESRYKEMVDAMKELSKMKEEYIRDYGCSRDYTNLGDRIILKNIFRC